MCKFSVELIAFNLQEETGRFYLKTTQSGYWDFIQALSGHLQQATDVKEFVSVVVRSWLVAEPW